MANIKFINFPSELDEQKEKITSEINDFLQSLSVLEKDNFQVLIDKRTNAFFSECHIPANELIEMGTIDVPLDPENQPEYRANREKQEEHSAYKKMLDDAKKQRMFSNIVCEYNVINQPEKPLKIIGGQHRYLAIENALKEGINEYHGIKIYFLLDKEQRLDVQMISNTNISVSSDLLDRMFETAKGPELRDWCQEVGLLKPNEDFSDRKQRGSQLTVRGARTFIFNFFKGKEIDSAKFNDVDTTPHLAKTGDIDEEWQALRDNPNIWIDAGLIEAGKKLAELHNAQQTYFKTKPKEWEFSDKAISYSILAAWAYITGVLQSNRVRLDRHFNLSNHKGSDPLSSTLLGKAKHKSDPENYRGLGTRTDVKDRGRLAELFFLQGEKGGGFTKQMIETAMKLYHAKQSNLEAEEARKKLDNE